VKQVPLSEIQNNLDRFLSEAQGEEIAITRNGKPAGVLIGFGSEDDWFDYAVTERVPLGTGFLNIATQRVVAYSRSRAKRCHLML
jgi:prevent-host-death family protein